MSDAAERPDEGEDRTEATHPSLGDRLAASEEHIAESPPVPVSDEAEADPRDEIAHGSQEAYDVNGCRCERCMAAAPVEDE